MSKSDKDILEVFYWFVWLLIFAIIISLFIGGCNTIKVEEQVIDKNTKLPVKQAVVKQWTNEGFYGTTITDNNGKWSMIVPPDTIINLCIFDPKKKTEACYENDGLLTPSMKSGSNKMIRI